MLTYEIITISAYTNNNRIIEELNNLNIEPLIVKINPTDNYSSKLIISFDEIDINPKDKNKFYIQFINSNNKKLKGFNSYIYNDSSLDIIKAAFIPGLVGIDLDDIKYALNDKELKCNKLIINDSNVDDIYKELSIKYKDNKPSLVLIKGGNSFEISMLESIMKLLEIKSYYATIYEENSEKNIYLSLYV